MSSQVSKHNGHSAFPLRLQLTTPHHPPAHNNANHNPPPDHHHRSRHPRLRNKLSRADHNLPISRNNYHLPPSRLNNHYSPRHNRPHHRLQRPLLQPTWHNPRQRPRDRLRPPAPHLVLHHFLAPQALHPVLLRRGRGGILHLLRNRRGTAARTFWRRRWWWRRSRSCVCATASSADAGGTDGGNGRGIRRRRGKGDAGNDTAAAEVSAHDEVPDALSA